MKGEYVKCARPAFLSTRNRKTDYLCPVKWLMLLFAAYLLLLPCVPCSDTDECGEETAAAMVGLVDHNDHPHPEDACNPFCNCACCGQIGYSFGTVIKEMPFLRWENGPRPDYYTNAALPTDYWGNIWQPPRFS
jgi:hypothetical protein